MSRTSNPQERHIFLGCRILYLFEGCQKQEGGVSTTNFLNLRQEKKKPRLLTILEKGTTTILEKDYPTIFIRSFPSTVLYSARGGSGASRPLYNTVDGKSGREAPEPPLALYNTVDGKLRNLLWPLYNTVDGKLRNLLWHCIILWTGSSGTSSGTV